MIAMLENNAQSWEMGGRRTRHWRERRRARPPILRCDQRMAATTAGYSPRYCRVRESALVAWVGVKLSMQASSE